MTALAAVSLLVWLYLALARGDFWRVSKWVAPAAPARAYGKRVVAVVPARNEAGVIGTTLRFLLEQSLEVVLVDDGSTDGTAQAAYRAAADCDRARQLTILQAESVEPEWTGKLWALSRGTEQAERSSPDYLLFTDADVRHDPGGVAALIDIAESGRYDLVSFMAQLQCTTPAEKLLIPAFVFFFLKLYPPAWIRSPRGRTAGAAGGCILIRPQALRRIGGVAAIRGEIIDDCALAHAVKASGGRIWLGLTEQVRSVRPYESAGEIMRMISRTAFNQLRHSFALLGVTLAGLAIVYVLPPALLLTGRPVPMLLGASAWLLMACCYLPMVRFYRLPAAWSFSLPAAAVFYAGATVHSAVRYASGRGGEWKGRRQDLKRSSEKCDARPNTAS